jgi:calcineurin-like phosphoesterase family protein
MSIYYIGDLHDYHKNVLRFDRRPWKTVEDMREGIIFNWNNLFDSCFNTRYWSE